MKAHTLNMTEGSILRNLLYFAIPVLIGNIFQQLYNVADTAIIGNILGDDALAAVGVAAPVYNLLIGFASGLTNGFAVIIARYFGANNEREMKKSVSLTYILSAIIAFVLTSVSIVFLHPLMKALKTPDNIITDTESYMRIIIIFSVLTIAYNMLAGMMRAIGNSKAPLYFLIISTFVNIGLDFMFVKAFNMGVAGAAYATVISQGVSVVLCFVYALKKMQFSDFQKVRTRMGQGTSCRPDKYRAFNGSDVRYCFSRFCDTAKCSQLFRNKHNNRTYCCTKNRRCFYAPTRHNCYGGIDFHKPEFWCRKNGQGKTGYPLRNYHIFYMERIFCAYLCTSSQTSDTRSHGNNG